MWMFKSISGKDQAGLEGRVIEIGNIKIRLQNAIAEGGFSCVYLAHDAVNPSNHYALKHMICQDAESLDLALKEIQVMKALKGHSNVVTLVAHSILDVGRRKEALLLMEFCEKSLVSTLEIRGAGYFEEKQVLLIFRDICNAVFAMHSHSPPIAHRDLKAENVLLGSDGAWKLCDFGSTSTNHKCFDKPEEMGIEEDNIRKHTTPAYRAPEMWDLYKREVISEKVDIWALGCLLYRICYFKLAFDGESKLQILNGNYRFPEMPKYSADVTRLIKEMLEGSPDSRPDITQVWFRVNELLPVELQKHLPDGAEVASTVNTHPPILDVHDGGALNRNHVRPKRSPPPPPSLGEKTGEELKTRVSHGFPTVASSEDGLGAFWSTQFAQDSQVVEGKGRLIDEEPMHRASKHSHADLERRTSSSVERRARTTKASVCRGVEDGQTENLGTGFSLENTSNFQNQPFTPFVTDFDSNKADSTKAFISKREQELEAEVKKLKEQLKQVNLEKTEVTSKFEKLSVICRSQRQEIQELKLAQATSTPPSEKESSKSHVFFSGTLSKEKNEGSVSDSQKEMLSFKTSSSPDPKSWQAFTDEPKQQLMPNAKHSKSVRTNNNLFNSTKKPGSIPASDDWGFHQLSFTASPPSSSETFRSPVSGSSSQRFAASNVKKVESSQPGGWAGF